MLPASLDPLQFAYRSNRSTDDAIAFTLHTALSHLENKNTYVRMLFLDYSSAFNTIVPATLVAKLQTLGLNRSLCSWILDFLTGRIQVVRMGNNTSSPLTLNAGAPQGCVLSPLLKVLPFHTLCTLDVLQAINPQQWFTTIDLKDAFFHVPIAPQHRPFLRFAFQGRVYQFCLLPFGLSLSPQVFTRCMSVALYPIQAQGVHLLPYLDDWLLCAPSREQAIEQTSLLISHVTQLGLKVNFSKSQLVPCQSVKCIGILLDSKLMKASPSPQRVDNILLLLKCFWRHVKLPFKCVLSLMGMLAAAKMVIPLDLHWLRPYQRWVNSLRLNPTWHKRRIV